MILQAFLRGRLQPEEADFGVFERGGLFVPPLAMRRERGRRWTLDGGQWPAGMFGEENFEAEFDGARFDSPMEEFVDCPLIDAQRARQGGLIPFLTAQGGDEFFRAGRVNDQTDGFHRN